ncbi:MAG: hypothetical protein C5B60_08475 [Chloroflexi bacterium]|nr:MAG: hypothetical protein C5B60_08475 [Chloroflexota bacterium]
MAKKSKTEWADILGPARKFEATVSKTRSLYDLPLVAEGAKEIALLSIFKEEQRFAFEPVMRALQRLRNLPDWSHQFFVADRIESEFFDWRKMPLRQYASFDDFYRRELEETWGKWEDLQRTYTEIVNGSITEDEGIQRLLGPRGRPKKDKEKGYNITLKQRGTSRAYTIARLKRDGLADLAARVHNRKLSAVAARREAGYEQEASDLERMKKPWLKKLWHKLSSSARDEFLSWLIQDN